MHNTVKNSTKQQKAARTATNRAKCSKGVFGSQRTPRRRVRNDTRPAHPLSPQPQVCLVEGFGQAPNTNLTGGPTLLSPHVQAPTRTPSLFCPVCFLCSSSLNPLSPVQVFGAAQGNLWQRRSNPAHFPLLGGVAAHLTQLALSRTGHHFFSQPSSHLRISSPSPPSSTFWLSEP